MFFYKEYDNYLVKMNMSDKTKFYTYFYILKLKKIIILIKYISIRYNVISSIYDMVTSIRNVLFLHNYLNYKLIFRYNNATKDFFKIYISNNLIYKYNMFYLFYIGYNYREYEDYFYLERKSERVLNKLHTNYKLSFFKFKNLPSAGFFSDIKSVSSTVSIYCDTNTNNYYLNKLYYSHTFLNIL